MKIRIACILTLVFFFCISCNSYAELEFDQKVNKQVDSIFSAQRIKLKKEQDSLCDDNFDNYFNLAIDSIRAKQIDEIKAILNK